jgi:hypothetical protein
VALAGRAGSRLAAALRMTAGRTCMLRLLMALPAARPGTVRVLDDFAFRRGRLYGTILIDVEAGRPVDLLPDRTAQHPLPWQQRLSRSPGEGREVLGGTIAHGRQQCGRCGGASR